jgi:hypothetical protein
LTAFELKSGTLAPFASTSDTFGGRAGPIPVITSDQQNQDSAIAWVVDHSLDAEGNIHLKAYNAHLLGSALVGGLAIGPWDSLYVPPINHETKQPFGYDAGGPYIEATVINGRVYVGCDTHVAVFSL